MENFVFKPLTDEEIEGLGLSVSDLWMIQGEGADVQGPFSTKFLIEKSTQHEEFFEACQIYNLVIEEWKDFFSSAEFQRRKPKLVPAQNLIQNDDFYILVKGQKQGPFNLATIKEKVSNDEIQVSAEVSVDEGKTWIKLYEHHEFDRRLFKNQEDLPFQPEQLVFDESDKVTSLEVARAQKNKENDTAITGLAFLGRGNDRGQTMSHQIEEISSEKDDEDESDIIEFKLPKSELTKKIESIKWKYVAGFFVFFVVSFSAFNTFNNKFSSNADKMVSETVKADSNNIENTDRSVASKKIAKPKTKRIQPNKKAARRYVPHKAAHKVDDRKRVNPKPKRVSHSYDDFENIDIDDPRVREELSRELAGEYGDDYDDGYDDSNEYVDDYEQEKREMVAPAVEPRYNDYPDEQRGQQYPDDRDGGRQENYDDGYDNNEPAYEEVSDYE